MIKRRLGSALGILVLLTVAACSFAGSTNPSSTLQDADLVGTWGLSYGRQGKDRLCLRADGTFKQIYTSTFIEGYRFETPWEQWWLERFSDGTVRLHLQSARYYRHGIQMAELDGLMPELPPPLSDIPGLWLGGRCPCRSGMPLPTSRWRRLGNWFSTCGSCSRESWFCFTCCRAGTTATPRFTSPVTFSDVSRHERPLGFHVPLARASAPARVSLPDALIPLQTMPVGTRTRR